jgi:hypothetical protein
MKAQGHRSTAYVVVVAVVIKGVQRNLVDADDGLHGVLHQHILALVVPRGEKQKEKRNWRNIMRIRIS